MTALQQLLRQLIDYAGLFPPAALPLAAVVKNHENYSSGPHGWMLGRLILPAARLAEFADLFGELFPGGIDGDPWKISALIPAVDAPQDEFRQAMDAIEAFNLEFQFARVDTVEGKLVSSDRLRDTIGGIPESMTAFLEIPISAAADAIPQLAAANSGGVHAKIRTGGVTPDTIPDSDSVAAFIDLCARNQLGFKATAGLHHPLRGSYRLTYDSDATRSTMHGFLNVFLAACFARVHHWSVEQLTGILKVTDPQLFQVSPDAIGFDGVTIGAGEIAAVRESFAISFGSCSFSEPLEEIQRPGWLEDAAPAER